MNFSKFKNGTSRLWNVLSKNDFLRGFPALQGQKSPSKTTFKKIIFDLPLTTRKSFQNENVWKFTIVKMCFKILKLNHFYGSKLISKFNSKINVDFKVQSWFQSLKLLSKFNVHFKVQNWFQSSKLISKFKVDFKVQNWFQISKLISKFKIEYKVQSWFQSSKFNSNHDKTQNYFHKNRWFYQR